MRKNGVLMEVIDFNTGWTFAPVDNGNGVLVDLPHDAMFHEKRTKLSEGMNHISWFPGGDYQYEKSFYIPPEWSGKHIVLEFEGVYRNAEVYLGGQKVLYRPYGYTNFYVDSDPHLIYGGENHIKVIARNSDQPNSRWYTGSGIYRPVHMFVMDQKHILMNGIRIKTLSVKPAVIAAEIKTNSAGKLKAEVFYNNHLSSSVEEQTDGCHTFKLEIPDGIPWSPDNPCLYDCRITFEEDVRNVRFGIRSISWDKNTGLSINGDRVILKGACVHHDNGLLGACAFEEAERRKVTLLKAAGYNAIRSAHNPCSKFLLKACDELGMLVMDEYTDMWYIHKTRYDYAGYMEDWWRDDLKDMVDKDYNHPSVILYSTGNEVSETAQERGIRLTGEMTEYLHGLDDTRPVTCGVNLFFNLLSSIGFGVYSDEKAKQKKKPVGSEFYNVLAGLLGAEVMKRGAALHGCDIKTRDGYANMDIAGYNYGISRYQRDLRKYPDRLILGTETFCKDAFQFMELAKENPRIIGDFVWSGMDYLGEAGIGAWVYDDYAPVSSLSPGWLTAGSGRLDITGREGGEAAYTKVALEKTRGPLIAVRPVYQKGKHSPSAWKMTDAMESWTWPGCEGQEAVLEIYARADLVKIYLNERMVAEKRMKKNCRTVIKVPYENGKITAVAFDRDGNQIGSHDLVTAWEKTLLRIVPEENFVRPGGLCYLRLAYTDEEGTLKPMERHRIQVEVTGGTLLALGNACPYNPEGYRGTDTETYYGEAMAVIKASPQAKETITIRAIDEERECELKLPVCISPSDRVECIKKEKTC